MADKHIHADLIIAWANGAEVQYFNEDFDEWLDTDYPMWSERNRYRVKPEPLMVQLGDKLVHKNSILTVNAGPGPVLILNDENGSWLASLSIKDAWESYSIEEFKDFHGCYLCAEDFTKKN